MQNQISQRLGCAARPVVAVSVSFATDRRLSSFAPSIAWNSISRSGSNSHSTCSSGWTLLASAWYSLARLEWPQPLPRWLRLSLRIALPSKDRTRSLTRRRPPPQLPRIVRPPLRGSSLIADSQWPDSPEAFGGLIWPVLDLTRGRAEFRSSARSSRAARSSPARQAVTSSPDRRSFDLGLLHNAMPRFLTLMAFDAAAVAL
jgi:hypothetical protein